MWRQHETVGGDHPGTVWQTALSQTKTPQEQWDLITTTTHLDILSDWLTTPAALMVQEAHLIGLLQSWRHSDHSRTDRGFPTLATTLAWHVSEIRTQDLHPRPVWVDALPEVLTDPRALAVLAQHDDLRIRLKVASNPHTDPTALSRLLRDHSPRVRRNASETFSARLGSLT